MDEFDIAKYDKFLDKNPDLETSEHWARASKTTYTLFNVLIDQDLRELVFVLERYPHYVPLVCGHFRYSYGYSEHIADLDAASKLLFMGEAYKTNQFMRNVLIKLPKLSAMDASEATVLLKKLENSKESAHPAVLHHYKKEFAKWIAQAQIHPLQKIVIKKSIESLGADDYDDLSSSDKDDGLNIPYLA